MAYSTPKTWVGGDPLNAANLNQYVRDQQSGLKDLLDANATADAAAVARLDVIDAQRGDYTTVEQLDDSISLGGGAVLTSILVPVCKTLLISFRRDFLDGWLPEFSIPYALYSLLTALEAGDNLAAAGAGYALYARADDNEHDIWYVGRRADGRLLVSSGNVTDPVRIFDQVCARFVIGL